MGGCAAINCTNHSRNKFRLFKFPADEARKRKWVINCRRDGWVPGPRAELCEVSIITCFMNDNNYIFKI